MINIGHPYALLYPLLKIWYENFDIISRNGDINETLASILSKLKMGERDRSYMKHYLTWDQMRNNFYHEISHWISDSLHGRHIYNGAKKATDKDIPMEKYYKVPDMIFSHVEMDAYMNGIYATFNRLGKEKWDTLTFVDLLDVCPALQPMEQSKHKDAYSKFKRSLFSRLNREGLLGRNMRGSP
jgi:hypothetical protein